MAEVVAGLEVARVMAEKKIPHRHPVDSPEARSERIDQAARRIMSVIQTTCQARRLAFDIQPRSDTPPVRPLTKVVQLFEASAREKGIKTFQYP